MALLAPLSQNIAYFDNFHFSIVRVNHDGGTNTLTVPRGGESVGALPATGKTAPTVTISGTTVTLTGGANAAVFIVTRHTGNAAAIG